jgi:crotonobetainyl-CoA:carnitine CoA-transferase CaiB-like acyl-CoA transferase
MVRFPGFGLDGPYAHFKGYGATMEAVVGHTMLRGYRDSDPSLTPPIYHGDPNAGAHVAFSVQAALIARERTGQGQLIEISQAEAVLHHTSYALLDYVMNQRVQEHWGNRHPSMAPYGLFPTRGDQRYLALAVDSDESFAALCRVLGRPEVAQDPRFADAVTRYREQDALEPLLAELTRDRDNSELMHQLQAAGVVATAVAHQDEMVDDPHLKAREFFIELEHPFVPRRPYPGPMARFRELPLVPVRGPAPTLGQHTREVLHGILGLDDARLDQLAADQVTGTAYLETAR